ncbi:MAG: VWA domain-containing protein [Candidatus Gastranaerophilales bacterium]|nr:VWA domain-containing protein [Candidatus Gastranaerophilales bacterium]
MLARRLFIISGLIIVSSMVLYFVISSIKNIKVDNFKPASIIFLIDSSASNQAKINPQKKYIKQLCSTLDPEDKIKIIKVSEDAYLIYEGSPQDTSGINKSLNSFTKFSPNDKGTAYGEAVKKAMAHCMTMKKNGYVPAIVIIGDLENEGASAKQINWDTLPSNVRKTMKYTPDLTLMFLWAHPSKLDFVKGKLNSVLGEEHLILATEETVDKVSGKFFKALGR